MPSAHRDAARRSPHAGPRTRRLWEILDPLVNPDQTDELLSAIGWSEETDGPADPNTSARKLVEGPLYLRLVTRVGPAVADQVRRRLRARLGSMPPRNDGAASSSTPPARNKAGTPTVIPKAAGATVVFWSEDRKMYERLREQLGSRITTVMATEALQVSMTLQLLLDQEGVVLIDRRQPGDGPVDPMYELDPQDLRGHQVVVWGCPTLDTPQLQELLIDSSRAVGCSAEARVADVRDLCVMLLGPAA